MRAVFSVCCVPVLLGLVALLCVPPPAAGDAVQRKGAQKLNALLKVARCSLASLLPPPSLLMLLPGISQASSETPFISLNSNKFEEYVLNGPRPYSLIVVLTSHGGGCRLCEMLDPELRIVAAGYEKLRYENPNAEGEDRGDGEGDTEDMEVVCVCACVRACVCVCVCMCDTC